MNARRKRSARSRPKSGAHQRRRSRPVPGYTFQKYLCSPGEFRFCQALREAVGAEFIVMMKVRAAALLACAPERWEQDGRRVSQKEFDFVLVRHGTSRAVAAVELDDRTHDRRDRRRRDRFLDEACRKAGLPLLRFKARREYHAEEIRRHVLARVPTSLSRRSADVGPRPPRQS